MGENNGGIKIPLNMIIPIITVLVSVGIAWGVVRMTMNNTVSRESFAVIQTDVSYVKERQKVVEEKVDKIIDLLVRGKKFNE